MVIRDIGPALFGMANLLNLHEMAEGTGAAYDLSAVYGRRQIRPQPAQPGL
ncbi:hypothetical protein DSO57_1004154 [Entomophthora muscae]|uniref:Uncharacterized protein n=1 Tax=Entomophthora muscae TaxID=34485 RepID=A0ACC2UIF9_9FUNG|nr:hypothetical protein DSO57_1004154 [Entomophthora muscae]